MLLQLLSIAHMAAGSSPTQPAVFSHSFREFVNSTGNYVDEYGSFEIEPASPIVGHVSGMVSLVPYARPPSGDKSKPCVPLTTKTFAIHGDLFPCNQLSWDITLNLTVNTSIRGTRTAFQVFQATDCVGVRHGLDSQAMGPEVVLDIYSDGHYDEWVPGTFPRAGWMPGTTSIGIYYTNKPFFLLMTPREPVFGDWQYDPRAVTCVKIADGFPEAPTKPKESFPKWAIAVIAVVAMLVVTVIMASVCYCWKQSYDEDSINEPLSPSIVGMNDQWSTTA